MGDRSKGVWHEQLSCVQTVGQGSIAAERQAARQTGCTVEDRRSAKKQDGGVNRDRAGQGRARGRGRAVWGAGAIVCAVELCQKQRLRGNRPFAAVAELGSCGQHLTQQRRRRAVQGVLSRPLQLEWLWQHHFAPPWMCAAQQQARCRCDVSTHSYHSCSPAG